MNTNEEKEREAFEKLAFRVGYSIVREGDGYLAVDTGQLWSFWKAGRAALRAEGEAVPMVVTNDMVKAGNNALAKFQFYLGNDEMREVCNAIVSSVTPPSPPSNRELKAMPDLPEELFEWAVQRD